MKVLIDTSIWSIAFIRKTNSLSSEDKLILDKLIELINEVRVVMIGPIRQEILSGIADEKQFQLLKEKLSAFVDLPITTEDYELAAEFFNLCRNKGIQGSHIDFLIFAVAYQNQLSILTADKDFEKYSQYIKIDLYNP